MAYLNNAATTVLKPDSVKNALPADSRQAAAAIAKLLGCRNPENVILTQSGDEAVHVAVESFIRPGDHVISTDMEYASVLDALKQAEEKGCSVTYIPLNEYGTLRYDLIEEAIRPETRAIVCCHGSNVTGNIIDLEKVCTIARRNKIMVIADGAQTIGATPVNVEDLQLDVFCFAGHKKLMGPYGTGGICLRDGLSLSEEAMTKIHTPSEEKLGQLCAAVDFIFEKGIYGISMFPHRLAKRFFESVKSMKNVTVYGDFGTTTRIPTVAINVKGFTPEEVKVFMRKNNIAIRSGDCGCPRLMESLGAGQEGVARFSFGYFNTRMEVNDAIWTLMKLQDLDDLYLLA